MAAATRVREQVPAPDDWAGGFGDATVAAAMLDRLLHRAAVAGIDGPSYRLRNHQTKADTIRAGVNSRAS
ncbi:hypothetical protein GCM10010195_66960 [Kitasatospora griseola]|nr:hypothetical protein GCM10010195_66960 [Kitasatospora griseola]